MNDAGRLRADDDSKKVPAAARTFVSYSREDADFALTLAKQLRSAGAHVWVDQLDIKPGQRWDRAIEDALADCPNLLVILSPASVDSANVMDEVSLALDERKTVIPVIYRDCKIPFRLRRLQHVDFRLDYDRALTQLLEACGIAVRVESKVGHRETPLQTKVLAEVTAALRASYIRAPQIEELLRTKLDRRFDDLTSRYLPLGDNIAEIVRKAHEQGWLADLIRNAAEDRPNNRALLELLDVLSDL